MSQLSSLSQKRGGPGTRYLVRPGDTLWDLAGQHLADPRRWPEIYEHNNDPRIVALTKSSIADPDLIFVGQQIYIPADTPAPLAVRSASHRSGGRRRAVREIQSFPFTYSLKQLPEITIVSPTHIATLKLTGSVTIQAGDLLNFATFRADGNIVSKMKREADLVFQKLVSDASVAYDPKTNSVKIAIGFTIHSKNGYTPSASLSASVSTKTGLPALKASILMPPIKGEVMRHLYVTQKLGIEIELSQRSPRRRREERVRVNSPVQEVLLVVAGAALIIVATALILEDAFPILGGPLNDPIAAAALTAALGLGVFGGRQIKDGQPIAIPGGGPSEYR